MFVFRKIWPALFSQNTRFEIRPFALLPANSSTRAFQSIHALHKQQFCWSNTYCYLFRVAIETICERPQTSL